MLCSCWYLVASLASWFWSSWCSSSCIWRRRTGLRGSYQAELPGQQSKQCHVTKTSKKHLVTVKGICKYFNIIRTVQYSALDLLKMRPSFVGNSVFFFFKSVVSFTTIYWGYEGILMLYWCQSSNIIQLLDLFQSLKPEHFTTNWPSITIKGVARVWSKKSLQ